jgi:hypothetical protein
MREIEKGLLERFTAQVCSQGLAKTRVLRLNEHEAKDIEELLCGRLRLTRSSWSWN